MLKRALNRGFSLIELMIAVAVLGVLLAAGTPAFMNWIQNSQIRVAAESVKNGLQLARAEAVRLNRKVRFQLTDATETGWKVNPLDDPDLDPPIGIRTHSDGSRNVTVAALPAGSTEITFEPLGTVSTTGGSVPLARIDFSNPLITSTDDRRDLRIIITSSGHAKMCDPKVTASSDPRKCP